MSSSISRFEPIPRYDGRTAISWIIGIGLAFAGLGAAAATVAMVDPFNAQILESRFPIDRARTYRFQNVPLWAENDISRDPLESKAAADTVVLGDSRGEQLRGGYNAARAFQIMSDRYYDLSYGGASLEEMASYYQRHRNSFKNLRRVIIVLPISKMVSTHDKSEESFAAVDNPLRYLLSPSVLKKSLDWLIYGDRDPDYVEPWRFTRDPGANVDAEPSCTDAGTTAQLDWELRKLATAIKSWRGVADTMLADLLAQIRKDGAEPVIFVPPVSPDVRDFIAHNMADESEAILERLRSMATVYRVPTHFEELTGWADAVHVCSSAALQLLPMLYRDVGPA